jgi:RND family efflux transporter MFP subunit
LNGTLAPVDGALTAIPSDSGGLRALVTAPQRAMLAAGLAGRILDMPVRPGLPFTKGDPLVHFDCAPMEASLNGAKAALRGARAAANAKERLASFQSIGQAEVDMARASAAEAKAAVDSAEITVSYCTIKAPYDGHVVDFAAHPFETVQQSQPVLEIIGDSALEVEIIVPSGWLSWLRVGSGLTVHIDETGSDIKTKVSRIGAQVDPASQSVVVTAEVPASPTKDKDAAPQTRLRAGMSGTAMFEQKP